tara:strand:- start:3811 stop:5793 length:1983 start_codon:yes stop_codon:yes gene_type:complete
MKISKNWLEEFLKLPKNINLENDLTQLGLEVDTIRKYKDDNIIDIEFTPNRGDCLSVYGTARDLAAYNAKKIKIPLSSSYKFEKVNQSIKTVSSDICPEYRYMTLTDIDTKISTPKYIKEKLTKSDIASINIIVDISNYVMLELGQPTHAFDRDTIAGKLSVIKSKQKNKFIGIDNKEYKIDKGTPVIIDEKEIIHAIPGVIGSKISSVTKSTTNVLFESAFFLPDVVRSLSRKFRIQTDSSYRFERGVDYCIQEYSLSRIHYILNQIINIEECKLTKISKKHISTKQKSFKFDYSLFKRILGINLSQNKIKNILTNLGFIFTSKKIIVPSYRFDVTSNYDLVEEVSRVYGYDNIPESPLISNGVSNKSLINNSEKLVILGYKEVINFTFIAKNYTLNNKPLTLENPISKDKSVMRDSLIPGLLNNIFYNSNRQSKSIQLFERGKIYNKDKTKIIEPKMLSGVLFGYKSSTDLVKNQYEFGIDDIKSDLLTLIPGISFRNDSNSTYFDSVNSLQIFSGQKCIGECGLVSSVLLNDFDIKSKVFAFEIFEDEIFHLNTVNYTEISQFPSVYKDITLITSLENNITNIINTLQNSSYKYLKNIRIKDIFINKDNLQSNNRNVTLEICLQSNKKTLSEKDINKTIKLIISDIKIKYKLNIKET